MTDPDRAAVNRVLDSLTDAERRAYVSFVHEVYQAGLNGEPAPLVYVGDGQAQRSITDRERMLMEYGDTSFARRREESEHSVVIGGTRYWQCFACGQWLCMDGAFLGTRSDWPTLAVFGRHCPGCHVGEQLERWIADAAVPARVEVM